MSQQQYDFGMIGLGVMGRNFLHNVADNGYAAIGLDLQEDKAEALNQEAAGRPVMGTTSTEEFVKALKRPRKIMLLVPAGKAVDAVIKSLEPYLEEGDLIIDGGNSFYENTNRRVEELKAKGYDFLGVGVSGGAEGARRGPSIMPGGDAEAYKHVQPILEAVAAKVQGEPCVTYLGPRSAGQYVKMVHNGIEYGMMQLIAETYDVLKRIGGLDNQQLHQVFDNWNKGNLRSFLVEITAAIFAKEDDQGSGWLVDKILDKAKQKGTGKWTSQNAMDLGIPIPTIDAAVTMRGLSAQKSKREEVANALPFAPSGNGSIDQSELIQKMGDALYFAFITTYAQGMHLLAEASKEYDYQLNMEAIARIWRGGCIIRADLLELIRQAYDKNDQLENLVLSETFQPILKDTEGAMRWLVQLAAKNGIPTLCLSSTLGYFDAFRTARLPLNLVQAQRDYFGSHTYERIDKEGIFHTEW